MRAFFVSLAALPAILWVSSTAWAQPQTGSDYGHHMWGGGSWMIFGPLMMLVFIAAIVFVVVFMVRWFGGPGHGASSHAPPGRTPVDILKERFALGEIDKEEFEERRNVLGE